MWRVSAQARVESNEPTDSSVPEEAWLAQLQPSETHAAEVWLAERLAAASSPDARARFLSALALGNVSDPRATATLASIAIRDMDDRWTRAAVLSGIFGRESEILKAVLNSLSEAQAKGSGAQQFFGISWGQFQRSGGAGVYREKRTCRDAAVLNGTSLVAWLF